MNIAILSPFHPYRGGLAQLNTNLYKELIKNGCNVKAFNFKCLYPRILFPGKTQYVENPKLVDECSSVRILDSINPLSYKKTADEINKYNPNVLIIPYWISFLAPAFGTIAYFLNKKIKIVALVHNALPHERRFFDVFLTKYFFRKCDAFIVMSDYVEKDLLRLIPKAKILYNEHPIYQQFNKEESKNMACNSLKIDCTKKNILFFGLIREYKGLDILIEAMDLLDDSYQLIIAGESYVDFEKYQALINTSRLKNNIKVFEQYIPEKEVSIFFASSDLLVLPYRSATQSGVLAVAYQLEKPIVSTNVGALGTAIKKAETGIVVDDISPKSIAEGIKSFFSEGNQKVYLENIRSEKDRLSWSSFTKRLINFLDNKVLENLD